MIKGVDVVCCAVPDSSESKDLIREAERAGAVVVCGDERDVLARYNQAAKALKADVIMRVTSDCPLIDPKICSKVLLALKGHEYASNNKPRRWPHGLDCEAFTREALTRATERAVEDYHREHVTPWMRAYCKQRHVLGPGEESQRWTLDYPEDYIFLKALFEYLPSHITSYAETMKVLSEHPEITLLNALRREAT